jgi:hypothetical protein
MSTTAPPVPAVPDDDIGLGDIDETDLAIPRLLINGPEAKFEDSLTHEMWDTLDVILLGLVKQRVLWPPTMGDDKVPPLCKSLDAKIGRPDVPTFPWAESQFTPPSPWSESDPQHELDCSACPLKEWGSHPSPDRQVPWCNETHVLPLLMPVGEGVQPALLTLKSSGIKPSKAYISGFVRSKTPLYTVLTRLSLDPKKRGQVRYAVPILSKKGATDQADWYRYAGAYRQLRTFVQTPRVFDEAESAAAGQAPAPASTQPSQAGTNSDDLPW